MGIFAVAVVAALAAKGRKAGPKLDPSCEVKAIYADGTEESRDCYAMGAVDLKPGCAAACRKSAVCHCRGSFTSRSTRAWACVVRASALPLERERVLRNTASFTRQGLSPTAPLRLRSPR